MPNEISRKNCLKLADNINKWFAFNQVGSFEEPVKYLDMFQRASFQERKKIL